MNEAGHDAFEHDTNTVSGRVFPSQSSSAVTCSVSGALPQNGHGNKFKIASSATEMA
jgi:hypothetical protein